VFPWPVVVIRFSAEQQVARTELLRNTKHKPSIPIVAAFNLDKVLRQRLEKHHIRRCRRTVIADIRKVRTLLEVHALHQLRDHYVHVRVPLAVRVRRQVQWHPVEGKCDIRAVVEIEAAKKVLIGLAAARMLRDHDAGNRLQNLSRTKNGTILDFFCAHGSLGGGLGNAGKIVRAPLHGDGAAHGPQS
jgi:hypothetical protein